MNKRLFLLAVGLLSLACGGPRQRTRLGREQTETEIAAPAPGAAQYATRAPEGAAVTGGGDVEAVDAAMRAAAVAQRTELHGDPRLATLAEWIAERLGPGGEPPPAEVVDFFAWNLGLMEPTPHVMVLGLPDRAALGEHVQRSAEQFLGRQPYTHYGSTVLPRDGIWLVVTVLSWRHAEIDPIPRTAPAGAPIRVHGTLAAGYSNPTVVVQSPAREVTRLPAGSGPEFDVRVPTAEANGAYQVELLARGPHGESVIVNAPVYVGAEPPRTVRLPQVEELGPATDATQLRAQLLELLNRTRAETGLPPLTADPQLDAIAMAHGEDMRDHGFVGHVSPTTGSASDRVQRAGVRSGLVLENIGRGYTATEIHRGLIDSPGHRANLVSPDATHVGIGVVATNEDGRTAYLATEVFTRVAQAIDTGAAPADVLARIQRARAARGAPELRLDENVRTAAQEAADAFFAEPTLTQQDTVDRASQAMRRFAIAYRRVGGVMAVVSSLDEAGQLEPALDPSVQVVGIGVAQGNRPDTPPNAIAVVIVLAWER